MIHDIYLDNSALSILSCKRRFQLTVLQGLYTEANNEFTAFGSAFHTAIELIDKGMDNTAALQATKEKYPNVNWKTLVTTVSFFKLSSKLPEALVLNGSPCIEYKFKHLYSIQPLPNGDTLRFFLVGTIDRIYIEKNILVFLDYKTAANVNESSIRTKLEKYDLVFQLPFYVFAFQLEPNLPNEIKELLESNLYRTEFLLVFYNTAPLAIRRKPHGAYNSDFIKREVPMIINNAILEITQLYLLKDSPAPHTGMCVKDLCLYCPFKPACMHMGEEREHEYLSRFPTKTYNPLTFR